MEKIKLSNQTEVNRFRHEIESFCDSLTRRNSYAICNKAIYDKIFNDFKNDNVLIVKDLLIPNDSIYIVSRKPNDIMLHL